MVPYGVDTHVNITGTNNYPSPLLIILDLPTPAPLVLGGLFIQNAEFVLSSNVTLQAGFITIHDYATLTLRPYSTTSSLPQDAAPNPYLLIATTATLTVEDNSTLTWYPL